MERSILGLTHIGNCSSQCYNQDTVYHLLIIDGVMCFVIFIGKRNKDLSHKIFQGYPQWVRNITQQIYDVLKSLGNIA